MADGVFRVAVACEDEAHFALATGLADRATVVRGSCGAAAAK